MGFVQLSDDLAEWEWFDDKTTVYVCIRLLLGASWCEKGHKGVHLQRGQLALSQLELAEKCGITRQKLRTILERLIATRKITQTSTRLPYYIHAPKHLALRAGEGGEEEFEKFWSTYPKKTAKQQALKAFQKLKPDEELLNKMLSSLEQQKTSVQWTKNSGQFIPYPATWLNGRHWEDESEVQNGKNSTNHAMPSTESEWIEGFE